MSLFGKNWAGEILLETKRIFSLDHDASEQEVHEHLRSVESYDSVLAKANEAVQEELNTATALLQTANSEKEAFENRVKELDAQVASLQTNVAQLEKDAKVLQTDLDAKVAEIDRLKKETADMHTGGDTPPGTSKKDKTSKTKQLYEQYGIE